MAPPNISAPGACTWKVALKYKVNQSKNGKFTSNYKASPIDLKHKFPPIDEPLQNNVSPSKNKPLKKGLWKI